MPPNTPDPIARNHRGAVQLVDALLAFFVLVGILVLSPFYTEFIGMVSAEADPFTSFVLQLTLPLLIIALIVSVGVSARRRGV